MKLIPLLATLIIVHIGVAQAGDAPPRLETTRPNRSDSSMNLIDPALLGFGRPGFSIAVTASQPLDYDGAHGSLDYFDARLRLPAWGKDLGDGSFIGVGLSYGGARLDASHLLGLDPQTLQTIEIQFTAAHFPSTDTGWMGLLIVSPGLASDLNKIGSNDLNFKTIAVVGWQFSDTFTLAAAGFYSHTIGEDTAVPGVGIIWRPTDTFIVQLTPPIGAIGWTPSPDWTFSLAAYPGGGSWAVDQQGTDGNVEAIALSVWRAGLGVEHRFGKNWSVTALAGANFGGSLELRGEDQRVIEQRDLQPSAFGLFGVSWNF